MQFLRLSSRCNTLLPRLGGCLSGRTGSLGCMQYRMFSSYPSHIKLTMPALSPTMEQGNIAEWEKEVGELISIGDTIAQVETDKATVGMESNEEGYLAKILVPGATNDVPVGQLIGIMVEDESDVAAFKDYVAEEGSSSSTTTTSEAPKETPKETVVTSPTSAPVSSTPAPTVINGERIIASPLAKHEAHSRGVDLSQLRGSGPSRRIVLADVVEFVPSQQVVQETVNDTIDVHATDIPLTNIRKVIAQRLTQSKQQVPHYYLTLDIRMDNLLSFRTKINEMSEDRVSVNDFLIKASALSLMKVPECNSSWMGDKIRQYNYADISVAVATDNGLITPIIQDADMKGLGKISKDAKGLIEKARSNTLQPHEYQGGTFTISNLGGFGIDNFTAIINPPQACIMAVGASKKTVVMKSPNNSEDNEQEFEIANMMTVTLSCDHRVVDGAVGAKFLQVFKGYMENPETLIL